MWQIEVVVLEFFIAKGLKIYRVLKTKTKKKLIFRIVCQMLPHISELSSLIIILIRIIKIGL